MALDNYSDLKSAVTDWMARADLSGNAADWIKLAEARLNRKLPVIEVDTTLTGVVNSRVLDISALSVVAPIALFLTTRGDERKLVMKADGTIPYDDTSGDPDFWMLDGTNIDLDRPCDEAHTFRFRYRERIKLSDAAPTNWLLTNYPDIYLAAALVWGHGYQQEFDGASAWKMVLDEGIPEVRSILRLGRRGSLSVDPALWSAGRVSEAALRSGDF